MGFVDHLKGQKTSDRFREVAFGLHVVEGDLTKSTVTGTSPSHIVRVQHILGDTFGRAWKGPIGVWFRGTNRPAAKYRFHSGLYVPDLVLHTFTADSSTDVFTATHDFGDGDMIIFRPGDLPAPIVANKIYYARDTTMSTFKAAATSGGAAIDLTSNGSGTLKVFKNHATQGIDPDFQEDHNHSNTAWISAECPNGSEVGIPDANTKDNPPIGLSGIYECQLGDVYDNTGGVSLADQYLTNPADVIAFGCKEIRRYPTSRVDWQSIVDLRGVCDATVTPDYTTLLDQGVGLTGRYYDGSGFTTLKSKRVDPVIQYDVSTGAPALDIDPANFAVRWEGKIRFKYSETYTIYLTHNDTGKCWVQNLTTPIIDGPTFGTTSGTFAATADAFYDIKLEWTNASGNSEYKLEWQSISQPRQVIPQDRLYPKNEAQKRFECHQAFLARTNFDEFLRSVLFSCNGGYQDVDGKLKFFCIDELSSSFAFTEQNIVKNTFKFYPRFSQQELLSLPNRFVAEGRDLTDRYLQKFDPPLFYDLPELQDFAGRVIEEIIPVGNITRPQFFENIAHYAKQRTQLMACEFEGMPTTFPVLQGDKVTLSHSIPGWSNKQFLCLEATDRSTDKAPDNRFFKLLEW